MGYTHYFPRARDISNLEWDEITNAARKIIDASAVPVQKEYDEPEPPVITDSIIMFNGAGDDGHETFYLDRQSKQSEYEKGSSRNPYGFAFCKTAYKPYDEIVTAILTVCKETAKGGWDISSDGDESDWAAGINLAKQAHV